MIEPDPITFCSRCEGVIPDEEFTGSGLCLWCEAEMEREEEEEEINQPDGAGSPTNLECEHGEAATHSKCAAGPVFQTQP